MLTKRQKSILEEQIYHLIKESIFEGGFGMNNVFYEDGGDDNGSETSENENKRDLVMKWLDSEQNLHSVLSYKLWLKSEDGPGTKEGCRSEFSKKYNGHDDTGKEYSFSDDEINKLYNLRNAYIESGELDDEA